MLEWLIRCIERKIKNFFEALFFQILTFRKTFTSQIHTLTYLNRNYITKGTKNQLFFISNRNETSVHTATWPFWNLKTKNIIYTVNYFSLPLSKFVKNRGKSPWFKTSYCIFENLVFIEPLEFYAHLYLKCHWWRNACGEVFMILRETPNGTTRSFTWCKTSSLLSNFTITSIYISTQERNYQNERDKFSAV